MSSSPSSTQPNKPNNTVIALGNFDGVHLGHQKLLQQAYQLALKKQAHLVVTSFNPHPQAVLNPPHRRLLTLSDQETKIRHILNFGSDPSIKVQVKYLPFDKKMQHLSPDEFLDFLKETFAPLVGIVVGYNFRFGHQRKGEVQDLIQWGAAQHLTIEVTPQVCLPDGRGISTTLIRKALQEGNLSYVKLALGHPYWIRGIVVKGDGRGKDLGFPTANIDQIETELPKPGVYVVRLEEEHQKEAIGFWGVAHYGPLPTLDIETPRLEVHVLECNRDLYNRSVKVHFLHWIRGVVRFTSMIHLKNQIEKDVECAKLWIHQNQQ
ncbi:MAG: riboflavin biosynthesis protein RibF [Bdellovibrionaceae bacterium]|nr:riboflavin biosynthesis protein RibF [Pseudobdellovibrionaceae bacterium]MDW8189585.1 riboflavin biosynthesis protein RibF [Pseudobdellovibrionaceae bacterium]